jgi:hypothetical protein
MNSTSDSARWWEFYAVRYSIGTVTGAVVVMLLCRANPAMQEVFLGTSTSVVDPWRLLLLAGYGLTFCYLASSPILVLHAGRFLLHSSGTTPIGWKSAVTLLVGVVVLASLLFYLLFSGGSWPASFSLLAATVLAGVVWPQAVVVFKTVRGRRDLFDFYLALSKKRDAVGSGFTDSYKHLREHGNSLLIVVLEIALGAVLFAVSPGAPLASFAAQAGQSLTGHVLVLCLWISPAASAWLVGTLIERELVDSP